MKFSIISNDRREKFQKVIKEKVGPTAAKAGNQRHIASLRDAFALFTSFTLVFAVGIIFITLIFGGWGSTKVSLLGQIANWSNGVHKHYSVLSNSSIVEWQLIGKWKEVSDMGVSFFSLLTHMTLDYMNIYIAFFIGYFYSLRAKMSIPIIGGMVALISSYLSTKGVTGVEGLFTTILMSMFSVTILCRLISNPKYKIKLPESIPPIVSKSLELFVSIIMVFLIVAGVNFSLALLFHYTLVTSNGAYAHSFSGDDKFFLQNYIFVLLQSPFTKLSQTGAGNFTILFIYVVIGNISMFFGVHGNATVVPFCNPLLIILWIQNINGAHNSATNDTINGFILTGGMGFMPMLTYTIYFAKRKKVENKFTEMAKFGLLADFFQISEPILYGFPVVFNFKFFIPLVLADLAAVILVWLAISVLKWCPPSVIPIPWTTPMFLSGLLTTKFAWQSIPLTAIVFLARFVIWLPFIRSALVGEEKRIKEQKEVKHA